MTMERRDFLRTTAAIGLGTVFAAACSGAQKTSTAAQAPRGDATPEDTRAMVTAFLEKRGFTSVAPVPLVSGDPYNGGLQYDDDTRALRPGQYVMQVSARVEDIAKRDVPGTLPSFTIAAAIGAAGTDDTALLRLWLDFMITEAGLDPKRLRVTTTERARHCFATLAKAGIGESQIRLRSWDDALREGNGSGYFAPKGHPAAPKFESLSFEYVLSDGREIEIAELGYEGTRLPFGGGIGIERLTMARNDRTMSWSDRLSAFKQAAEASASATKRPLPPGYYAILGLPRPAGA